MLRWCRSIGDVNFANDGPVFIFDGFVRNGLVDSNLYLSKCKMAIERYCKEKNYIRFHPAQARDEQLRIVSFFKNQNVKYEIMNANIPFELYINSFMNMSIVGFGSSLLYFAYNYGHTVYCCDYWLLESKSYSAAVKKGYPIFNQYFNINERL